MPLLDRGWQRVLRLAADRQTQKLEAQMHRVASGAKKRTAELEPCKQVGFSSLGSAHPHFVTRASHFMFTPSFEAMLVFC